MEKVEFRQGSRVKVKNSSSKSNMKLKGLIGIIKSTHKRKGGRAYVLFSGTVRNRFIPIKDLTLI